MRRPEGLPITSLTFASALVRASSRCVIVELRPQRVNARRLAGLVCWFILTRSPRLSIAMVLAELIVCKRS